jgi:type III pantothenate kinase
VLLAIDVGNSNIVFALFIPNAVGELELSSQFRVESIRTRPGDEYAALLSQLFELRGIEPKQIAAVIVASVVPVLTRAMEGLSKLLFQREAMVVSAAMKLGISVEYDDPALIGADRLVNAVAAYENVQGACIVVDMGTATTLDVVSEEGVFIGGAICLGVGGNAEALAARAARLPRIEIAVPPSAIAKNTVHAMQSGVVLGYGAMIDGLVRRTISEMQGSEMQKPRVIATGGFSSLIAPLAPVIDSVDADLTLRGLRILYERNR